MEENTIPDFQHTPPTPEIKREKITRNDAIKALEMRLYSFDQSQLERMIEIGYQMKVEIIKEYPEGIESRINLFE